MNDGVLKEKSYAFAVRIVKAYKWLCDNKKEYVLSKQLLRSGTSIGANITEAQGGISKADFSAKLSIRLKKLGLSNSLILPTVIIALSANFSKDVPFAL